MTDSTDDTTSVSYRHRLVSGQSSCVVWSTDIRTHRTSRRRLTPREFFLRNAHGLGAGDALHDDTEDAGTVAGCLWPVGAVRKVAEGLDAVHGAEVVMSWGGGDLGCVD